MIAAVLYETGRPLVIEDGIELPPLAEGQVLVRVAFSGVCHSQVMEARGKRGVDKYLPHLLGHEAAGTVLETGPGVTKVRVGDRAVLTWIKGAGADRPGAVYRKGGVVINSGPVTTFSDVTIVSENRCVKLNADIPMDVACLLGCAAPTGAGIVLNTIRPAAGSSIVVWGVGGIGASALMGAACCACAPIVAVDVGQAKLDLAMRLGATHCVNAAAGDPVAAVRSLTRGGADYAVEAAGRTDTIERAFECVRRNGGLCVFASHPTSGEKISLDPFELICGKQIRGSWGGDCRPDDDIPRLAALCIEGKLPLGKLIARSYELRDINTALEDVEKGMVSGRCVIRMPGGKTTAK